MALNSEKIQEVNSREELRKIRQEQRTKKETTESDKGRKPKKIRIRLIPVWAKFLIVIVLIFLFFMIGTMIGYGVLGDGSPRDAWKKSTWDHLFDLVNKEN